jgi:hypothetical protein
LWTVTHLLFLCNKFFIKTLNLNINKLTVSNLPFCITVHNAFVFADLNSSISATIQN